MDEHVRILLALGAVALCGIVGVYYCAVREQILKQKKQDEAIRVALSKPGRDERLVDGW